MSEELIFARPEDWGAWLAAHHDSAPEVWITYWKKGTGRASINWQEAVVEALCWGWIDGIRKSVDDARFTQRFTPRRKGSVWSQINRDHALRLIAEGRMQPSGLRVVEEAQANGRWEAAYAGGMAKTTLPPELEALLAASPLAAAGWAGLDKRNQMAICYRLGALKTPAGRARKLAEFTALLESGGRLV